jgi:hypothetical protein
MRGLGLQAPELGIKQLRGLLIGEQLLRWCIMAVAEARWPPSPTASAWTPEGSLLAGVQFSLTHRGGHVVRLTDRVKPR